MTATAEKNAIAERLSTAIRISAFGNSGDGNYLSVSHEPGAVQVSPFVGDGIMNLPRHQGDQTVQSAAGMLNNALQAAGLETKLVTAKDGVTPKGTAPVRIEFDESGDGAKKLEKAVKLAAGARKLQDTVSTWHSNWAMEAASAHSASGKPGSYGLGASTEPLKVEGDKIGFTVQVHDSSFVPTQGGGRFKHREGGDHSIPASMMGALAKLSEKLEAAGVDLRSVSIRDTTPKDAYHAQSISVTMPATRTLERIVEVMERGEARPTRIEGGGRGQTQL